MYYFCVAGSGPAAVNIPKLRGVVLELSGSDHVTVPATDPRTDVAGKTVPARVFRQGGFSVANSPKAIGHGGAHGQIAWGDPATGLSFSFVTNTAMNGVNTGREFERTMRLSALACACCSKPEL